MLDAKHLPRTYSNSAVTLVGWLIWVDNSYEAEISELSLFSMKVKVVSSQVGLFFHVFSMVFHGISIMVLAISQVLTFKFVHAVPTVSRVLRPWFLCQGTHLCQRRPSNISAR
jgi:hypothetical protein